MKPTSIIFTIISVILIVAGFVTISIAGGLAAPEGIILTISPNEDYKVTYEYENAKKIDLDIKEAEINIIGGAEKAKIELVNFSDGMYELSGIGSNTVSIKNNSSSFSLSALTSFITNFKGLGGMVNHFNLADSKKAVNIHVTDDTTLTIIKAELEQGNVNLKDCSIRADYDIKIAEGNLNIQNTSTDSTLTATINKGELSVNDAVIRKFEARIEDGKGYVSGEIGTLLATVDVGDFTYSYNGDLTNLNYKLFATIGGVRINGELLGGYVEAHDSSITNSAEITVSAGNISLSGTGADTE